MEFMEANSKNEQAKPKEKCLHNTTPNHKETTTKNILHVGFVLVALSFFLLLSGSL